MTLTIIQKKILKLLLENARIYDTVIGKKLNRSRVAIGKTRKRLEELGYIKGYNVVLDYTKLGINVFALTILKFLPKAWEDFGELGIDKRIIKFQHIINAYRVPEVNDATHIALFGFRDLLEMDKYFTSMKIEPSVNEYVLIKRIYVFSSQSIIKDSSAGLFRKAIDELGKPFIKSPEPII